MSSGSHSACDHTAPSCHSQASQEACCLASHLVGGVEDLQNRAQLPLGPSGLGAEDEASVPRIQFMRGCIQEDWFEESFLSGRKMLKVGPMEMLRKMHS